MARHCSAEPGGQIVPGTNQRGRMPVRVLVKRSYRIGSAARVARARARRRHCARSTTYYDDGDPEWSTVQHEYELAPYKALTDVVVIGKAYAPRGRPTQPMTVGVRVGEPQKVLRVFGDRQCHWRDDAAPVFSDPEPFTEMEIRYDRAYGGRDEKSDPDLPFFYPRNAMGSGVALRNVKESIEGLPLPNIEDPDDLLTPERVVIEDP